MSVNWNVDVSDALRAKMNAPGWQPVDEVGCVDARLYEVFATTFVETRPFPFWNSQTNPPLWQIAVNLERLEDGERQEFEQAIEAARKAETFFFAHPLHCVVGTKAERTA